MLTRISLQDICDSMQDLVVEKCRQYDLTVAESIDAVSVFARGWAMLCMSFVDPDAKEKYKDYIRDMEEPLDVEFPDSPEDLL